MGGALRRGPGARVQARLSAGERRDQYLRKRRAPQQPSVRSLAVPLSNDAPVPTVVQGGREKDVGEEAQTIGRGTTTREAAQEIARTCRARLSTQFRREESLARLLLPFTTTCKKAGTSHLTPIHSVEARSLAST